MEKVKLFYGELIYACLGNINSKFQSISFEEAGTNSINICFILNQITIVEEALIQAIVEEFEARHGSIDQLIWNSYSSATSQRPLKHIVFMVKNELKEIIFQEDYSYTLFSKSGNYFLTILLGGAAMFDFTFELNEDEMKCYGNKGKSYIESLVFKIQNNCKPYLRRKIES